jgi:hypothetical protein
MTKDRAKVISFKEAQKATASTHPLADAIVVIEIVSHGVTFEGERPLVDSDVFVATEPTGGQERAGTTIEGFWWKGAPARQLASLEPGQIIVARVTGTWMENLGSMRVNLDAVGLSADERDAALDAWEASDDDVK